MNSRERVVRAIERRRPDRIPITHVTLPGAWKTHGPALQALYAHYPQDMVSVGSANAGEYGRESGTVTGEYGPEIGVPSRDSWGSLWVRYTDEHKGQVVGSPLRDWAALATFQPPDTATPAALASIEQSIAANAGERYTMADGDTLWQRMFYLHGYQAMLEDLLLEPERCAELRGLILRVMLRRVEKLCRVAGLDGVHFRDDWGTQEALMIRPALWRAFFKPAYAQLFGLVRDAGKHVWFHSDGAIATIIPDLLEIGVQVLNPQVDAIGREQLAALCGDRVCIEGDLDRQRLLPFGTPEEVRAGVRADFLTFGQPDGGYIGRGEVSSDVPLVNAEAMLDEFSRCVYKGRE